MLTNRAPRPWWAVLFLLLAVLCKTFSEMAAPGSGASAAWISFAVVFLICGAVQGLDWWLYNFGERLDKINTAKAITPEWMLASTMLEMSAEALEAYTLKPVDMETMAMIRGPRRTYSVHIDQGVNNGTYTLSWEVVHEFLRRSDRVRLCPVRYFSQGHQRDDANIFVEWCINKNLAVPAQGNVGARWIGKGYEGALMAFGLTVEDLSRPNNWFEEYADLTPIPEGEAPAPQEWQAGQAQAAD